LGKKNWLKAKKSRQPYTPHGVIPSWGKTNGSNLRLDTGQPHRAAFHLLAQNLFTLKIRAAARPPLFL
jgi:hypothetical protein